MRLRDRTLAMRVLRATSPFRGLGEVELTTLACLLRDDAFDDGEEIFAEGDEAHEAFLVLEGTVHVVQRADGGALRRRAVLSAGALFGELALFGGGRRLAGAVACGRTLLGAVGREPFVAAIRAHASIAMALLQAQAASFAALELEHRRLLDERALAPLPELL